MFCSKPIVIQSLPNVITIHSNKPGPIPLHTLVVQSDLTFGCTVKSVSPVVPDGTFIIGKYFSLNLYLI